MRRSARKLFALAGELHNFAGADLDVHRRVADLGQKTFRYEKGGEVHETQFNYTINHTASQLHFCVSMGIALTIEDTWGGDIATAAIAHLAHSTPPRYLFTTTDFNSYVTVSIAEGAPQRKEGRMAASHRPGLGVEPRWNVLGKAVVSVG